MLAWAWSAPRLDTVSAKKADSGVLVSIRGIDLESPKEIRVTANQSYILQFDASLAEKLADLNVASGGVETISTNWYSAKPARVRVFFKLQPGVVPKLKRVDGGFDVSVSSPTKETAAEAFLRAANGGKAPRETTSGDSGGKVPLKNNSTNEAEAGEMPRLKPKPKPVVPEPEEFQLPQIQPDNLPKEDITPLRATPPSEVAYSPKQKGKKKSSAKAAVQHDEAPTRGGNHLVSLDFINTETGQILKALALQAGVNIVTAPDIKGSLTISLEHVTVDEALNFITASAGLRYSLVGRTYVVAPKDKFQDMVRQLNSSPDQPSETRLVPIFSGEPDQIKAAVIRAFPQDSTQGSFDIITPADASAGGTTKPAAGVASDDKASATASKINFSQLYLILVGNKEALDTAENLVKAVDKSICDAVGIKPPTEVGLKQDTYIIASENMSAKSLIDMVSSMGGTMFRNVQMYPSPVSSDRQAIILVGRDTEIERVKKLLAEFDGSSDDMFIYEVKFSDPRALRDALSMNVPGLRVSLGPNSSGNLRSYEAPPKKSPSAGKDSGSGDAGAASSGTDGQKAADVTYKGEKADSDGLTQPFSDVEKAVRVGMLVLRGNKAQIAKAKEYLVSLDIEPKQVALDLRVVELNREDALRLGLDWNLTSGAGFVRLLRLNQGLGDSASTAGTVNANGQQKSGTYSVLGTLDAIGNSRKIIARPNFLALDGRETELFVGDVVRYIESIQSSQNGVTVTTNSVRVGVRCAVLPRIGADGNITMDVRPVVSYLRGFTAVPGGGQLPQTSERIAQNSLVMKSGETIAIGGLIQDTDRKSVSGIPILKDLPIVGRLFFSRTDNDRLRSEIVFFLTAKVVTASDRGDAALPRANMERNNEDPNSRYPDPLKDRKKSDKKPG